MRSPFPQSWQFCEAVPPAPATTFTAASRVRSSSIWSLKLRVHGVPLARPVEGGCDDPTLVIDSHAAAPGAMASLAHICSPETYNEDSPGVNNFDIGRYVSASGCCTLQRFSVRTACVCSDHRQGRDRRAHLVNEGLGEPRRPRRPARGRRPCRRRNLARESRGAIDGTASPHRRS